MTVQINRNILNDECETFVVSYYQNIKKIYTTKSGHDKIVICIDTEDDKQIWKEIRFNKDQLLITK